MEAVGKEIAGSKVATVEDTVASDVETPRMGFTLSELEGMELSTVELDDSKVPCSGFVDYRCFIFFRHPMNRFAPLSLHLKYLALIRIEPEASSSYSPFRSDAYC